MLSKQVVPYTCNLLLLLRDEDLHYIKITFLICRFLLLRDFIVSVLVQNLWK